MNRFQNPAQGGNSQDTVPKTKFIKHHISTVQLLFRIDDILPRLSIAGRSIVYY